MNSFEQKLHCTLTVSEGSDHPFAGKEESNIVIKWLTDYI
jgi:hypothetical protein